MKDPDAMRGLADGGDSWRFPRLALLMTRDATGVSDQDHLVTLARDLAIASPADDAIALLVEEGALDLAEYAVGGLVDGGCSASWAESAYATIDAAEQRRRVEFERRRRVLAGRCHRAGLPRPSELDQALDYRRTDAAFLDALLAAAESEVTDLEAARTSALRERLADPALGEDLRQSATELLDAGEVRLAEQALASPDQSARYSSPRVDERSWTDLGQPLELVVQRLVDPMRRPASYAPFVPGPDDVRGAAFVAALGEVSRGEPGAAFAFARAVQRLIATWEVRTEEVDGVVVAHLELPEATQLPTLRFRRGRDPVAFAIGPRGTGQFRLSFEVTDVGPGTVDIGALLGVVSRSGNATRDQEERRVLFYRALCRNLPVRDVIDASSFAGRDEDLRRLRVAWMFYLFGYSLGPQQLALFMDLCGGVPGLVVSLAERAVSMARTEQADVAISRLYEDDELPGLIVTSVAEELDDPVAEIVVHLVLLGAGSVDAMTERLQAELSKLPDPVSTKVRYLADLSAGIDAARGAGLLAHDAEDFNQVPVGGLLLLPHHLVAARVRELTEEVVARHRAARLSFLGDRADANLDERVRHTNRSVERAVLQGRASGSARVGACCLVAFRAVREANPSVQIVDVFEVDDEVEVPIEGVLMWSAVQDLINNAAQAVHGRPQPQVRVSTRQAGGEVTICVEDNGPGFSDDVLLTFLDGAQVRSTKRDGLGTGLESARILTEELGGLLTIARSELGGAEVTVTLPV